MTHKITSDQTNNDPTKSNQKSPWETAGSSAIQGVRHILCDPKFYYGFHKIVRWSVSCARWFQLTFSRYISLWFILLRKALLNNLLYVTLWWVIPVMLI